MMGFTKIEIDKFSDMCDTDIFILIGSLNETWQADFAAMWSPSMKDHSKQFLHISTSHRQFTNEHTYEDSYDTFFN